MHALHSFRASPELICKVGNNGVKIGKMTDERTKLIIQMLTEDEKSDQPSPTEQIIQLLEQLVLGNQHIYQRLDVIESTLDALTEGRKSIRKSSTH